MKYTISGDTIDFSRNDSDSDAVWGGNCKTAVTSDPDITKITVSKTIRVTNAVAMFRDLSNIREMDLSNLDVSAATDMYEMFKGCGSLVTLTTGNWDTSNVTDMYEMFSGCGSLRSLDSGNWDTSKVMYMHDMFSGCGNLSSLDVSNWDTSGVTDMSGMFSGCDDLYSLDVSNWDTSGVTDMSGMFSGCYYLSSLDVSNWDTSAVTDMSGMFSGCGYLNSLDVSGWVTSAVTDMSGMFSEWYELSSLDVSNWDTSGVTDMSWMFSSCDVSSLDVSNWDTSGVTNMSGMFSECVMSSLDVSNWDTSKVMYMHDMFSRCYYLSSLDVSNWDTSGVTDMSGMFSGCDDLYSLDVSNWDTSNVTNMSGMFSGCDELSSLDVSGWDTSNVTNMSYMFFACSSLTSLDLSSWDTSGVRGWDNSKYIFESCGMTHIILGENSLKGDTGYMFEYFPRRDHRWYYIARSPEASSPLPLGTCKENGELFENYDPYTMAGTWAAISSVRILNPAGINVTGERVISSEGMYQLKASVDPSAAPQKLDWESSRTGIATVDAAGKVTFKAAGTVTINATAPDSGGISAGIELTYSPSAPAVSIMDPDNENITGQTLSISGDSCQLAGSVEPLDGSLSTAWSSSDPDIAEVDTTGKVTFMNPGMVTVTFIVTADDGSLQFAWVRITNRPFAEEVKIQDPEGNDVSGQTIFANKTEYQLSASALPAEAAQYFTWSSNAPDIAVVDPTGKVTFNAAGTVTITAEAEGSGISESVNISLIQAESVAILDAAGNDITDQWITIYSGEYQLSASASPAEAAQVFTWESDDTNIASVDSTGKVTFNWGGDYVDYVRITAAAADGSGCSASVRIYYDDEPPYAESVKIQDPEGNDISGQTISANTADYQLKAIALPSEAEQVFSWESSDTDIAEVDQTGKVMFKEAWSEVRITVWAADDYNWPSAWVDISFEPPSSPAVTILDSEGNDISWQRITVKTAEYQLYAAAQTDPAPDFLWESSDTDIAEVDAAGKVTFKETRNDVRITVTAADGSGESAWVVIRSDPPYVEEVIIQDSAGNEISWESISVRTAEYQLYAVGIPLEAAQNFIWESSDTDIAEVDATGKVTFKEAWSEVRITARADDWNWEYARVYLTYAAPSGVCGSNVAYSAAGDTITFSNAGSGDAVWGDSCRRVLEKVPDITKIVFSDTVRVTDASYMFYELSEIREMDLSRLDVTAADDMTQMFYGCGSLSSLDLSSWDTSNVTDMYLMFYGCSSLRALDVSSWNTSRVTDMSGMFYGCSSLNSLDVSGWKTFNVYSMSSMFSGCSSLSRLDVSGWKTPNVTNMSSMFNNCYVLNGLVVSGWNTSEVTNMNGMFMNCYALTGLDVSGWNVSKVTNISGMFSQCRSLTVLDVSSWNTSRVKQMGSAFQDCRSLRELDVSGWDTSTVTSLGSMFRNCYSLTALDVGNWNTSRVTTMSNMFYNCTNLSSLNVGTWNTSAVTNMGYMFYNCGSLSSLDLSTWNAVNVTSLTDVFYGCYNITSLTLGKNTLNRNIFTSLPKYYGSWYYITQGTDVSAPLERGTEKKGSTLFTEYDSNTMAGTWSADQLPLAAAITIRNSSGTDITGKTVTSNTVSYQLKASASPADAAQTVTWASSDTAVAAIDTTGKVTFKKAGTVKITAVSTDKGKVSAVVTLKLLPAATSVEILNSSGTAITGKTITSNTASYQLKAKAAPSDAAQTFTWKSSDTAVAAVDSSGKVTFKKAGTVTITAASTDRGKKAATVNLKLLPRATAITIMNKNGTAITGKTITSNTASYQLKAKAAPSDAAQTVTWKSSNTAIATVSAEGLVKFKKAGTVTITATSTDRGKKTAIVKLKLLPKATSIVIKNSSGTAITGKTVTVKTKTYQLKAIAKPKNASQKVTWKSSDKTIATVSTKGKVTFKKAGTVTITATSKDRGKKSGKVKLTYKPK